MYADIIHADRHPCVCLYTHYRYMFTHYTIFTHMDIYANINMYEFLVYMHASLNMDGGM